MYACYTWVWMYTTVEPDIETHAVPYADHGMMTVARTRSGLFQTGLCPAQGEVRLITTRSLIISSSPISLGIALVCTAGYTSRQVDPAAAHSEGKGGSVRAWRSSLLPRQTSTGQDAKEEE
jgi:hypothetical protein